MISINDIPNEYICPITLDIMTDPVICGDGYTYERNAILQLRDKISPMTRQPIDKLGLIPNRALKSCIDKFLESNKVKTSKTRYLVDAFSYSYPLINKKYIHFIVSVFSAICIYIMHIFVYVIILTICTFIYIIYITFEWNIPIICIKSLDYIKNIEEAKIKFLKYYVFFVYNIFKNKFIRLYTRWIQYDMQIAICILVISSLYLLYIYGFMTDIYKLDFNTFSTFIMRYIFIRILCNIFTNQ